MITTTYTVKNEEGLHARPAALLAKSLHPFSSEIIAKKGANSANMKLGIALIKLDLSYNTTFTIEATGDDEEAAVASVIHFFDQL